jgi:hypothetical protein
MSQYFAQADGSPRDRPRALSTQQPEAALVNGLAVEGIHMGPDLVGYIASGLVLLTFTAKSMLTLRILAILSNFAFIFYGIIDSLTPVLCLHAILLPLKYRPISPATGLP